MGPEFEEFVSFEGLDCVGSGEFFRRFEFHVVWDGILRWIRFVVYKKVLAMTHATEYNSDNDNRDKMRESRE